MICGIFWFVEWSESANLNYGRAARRKRWPPARCRVPPSELLAEVRLLNDDHTPMDFNTGCGLCGVFPYDIAEGENDGSINCAPQHQHPLQFALERSLSSE
jgi:ATP-dependent Clp protease adapter protein ClpS